MITGKVKDLKKIKGFPLALRKELEKKTFYKFPKNNEDAVYWPCDYSIFPDRAPCLFFYDEENQVLLFSRTSSYHEKKQNSFVLTYSIVLYYPSSEKGIFRCIDFNCFRPFPFQFENTDIPEIRKMTSKVRTLLLRASKLLPDADRIYQFLNASVD